MSRFHVEDFDPAEADPLTRMWRESFEFGVGITDRHPLEDQIRFLREQLVPTNAIRVVKQDGRIVGFSATTPESISALYVRVDSIGQGIGTHLLDLAKERSSGSLWLYTFARNTRARRFYERHGFEEGEHAFENMWGLEDVKYHWSLLSDPGSPPTSR